MEKTFTLGASTIPGEYLVPRLLSEIIKELPDLELKVDVSDSMEVFEKVKKGEIELGLIGTKYDSPEVDFVALVKDDHLVCIAPQGHPLVGKRGATMNDLKGQRFIGRELGSATRAAYEKALKDAGLSMDDLNVVAEISDTSGIIQAVEGGAGISVVSDLAAREAVELRRVGVLDIPMLKDDEGFLRYYPKGLTVVEERSYGPLRNKEDSEIRQTKGRRKRDGRREKDDQRGFSEDHGSWWSRDRRIQCPGQCAFVSGGREKREVHHRRDLRWQ
ncbi:MAG TPA: LysR substrate-binding domain-containing protein [Thermodesulfovibrionales bacterium]|nr:LysR substrate-binding domain-containing protein [Thermodesulfovibrionales bacterium]